MARVGGKKAPAAVLSGALGRIEYEVHGVGVVGEETEEQYENDPRKAAHRHPYF